MCLCMYSFSRTSPTLESKEEKKRKRKGSYYFTSCVASGKLFGLSVFQFPLLCTRDSPSTSLLVVL